MKSKETNNWVSNETPTFFHEQAKRVLKEVKKNRKNREFKLVKVSDNPLTYKEVEV